MFRAIFAGWVLTCAALASQIVEGHVVNSATGAGIAGVSVYLSQAGKIAYSAKTDAEGLFRIDAVQDGVYSADYKASGFWPVPNMLDRGTQRPIAVASGGDPVHIEVRMPPISKVSGRVVDTSGKLVAGATMLLVWEARWCRPPACLGLIRTSKANEKGEYTIADLDLPGAWLLSATAPASLKPPESAEERLGWAQTFYPGVADAQMASEVVVRPGGDLWNLDIKLAAAPVHDIRGRVLGIDGDPVPKAAVTLGKRYGAASFHQETRSDGTFEFEVASLAGDEWSLSASLDQDGVKLWAAESVEIKRHTAENVEVRLTAPFPVQGKIVMDVPAGLPAPRRPGVMLTFDAGAWAPVQDPGFRFVAANPDARGDFTIRNVYPGRYQIATMEEPTAVPYYLDSIRLGDRDAAAGIEILSSAQTLTVTYKMGGGSVRGTIEDCVDSRVLLVPQDSSLRRNEFMRYTSCGQDGRFEFSAVRPGEYYGLAIAGTGAAPWYQVMRDEQVLKQASRVTVRAGESTAAEIRMVGR